MDLSHQCGELKRRAKHSWDAGDKKAAHEFSGGAKKLEPEVAALHAAAAEVIFDFRNHGTSRSFIDLHGLRVDEAMTYLARRLLDLSQSGEAHATLEVVTGAGQHAVLYTRTAALWFVFELLLLLS